MIMTPLSATSASFTGTRMIMMVDKHLLKYDCKDYGKEIHFSATAFNDMILMIFGHYQDGPERCRPAKVSCWLQPGQCCHRSQWCQGLSSPSLLITIKRKIYWKCSHPPHWCQGFCFCLKLWSSTKIKWIGEIGLLTLFVAFSSSFFRHELC